ncbi:Ig-like domain-containing protein [Methanobrevibacter sp.]|jgi:hypothetical protein|uniref:Ig-like domain-containing protein n=1 Tax=Methanobrevibacter sp. TaxID=66852 RepID=UPI0025D632FD|nr:Ig-like domain-containing protein [Methanobrevibacter sp.]
MKYKKGLIFICLIICLFSIVSVCASDVNETLVANEEQNNELISEDCNTDAFDISEGYDNTNVSNTETENITSNQHVQTYSNNNILSSNADEEVLADNYDWQYVADATTKGIGTNIPIYVAQSSTGFVLKDGQMNYQRYFTKHSDGNYYPNCYAEDYLLPGTFKLDGNIYLLTEGAGDTWYYKKISYPPAKSSTIIVDDYDFENNQYPLVGDGRQYSTISIPISVLDSNGNYARGGVVITDSMGNQVGFASLDSGVTYVNIDLQLKGKNRYKIQFNSANTNQVASSSTYFYITSIESIVSVYVNDFDDNDVIYALADSKIALDVYIVGASTGYVGVILKDSSNSQISVSDVFAIHPYAMGGRISSFKVDMPSESGNYFISVVYGMESSCHELVNNYITYKTFGLNVIDTYKTAFGVSYVNDTINNNLNTNIEFDINVTKFVNPKQVFTDPWDRYREKEPQIVNEGYIAVTIEYNEYCFAVNNSIAHVVLPKDIQGSYKFVYKQGNADLCAFNCIIKFPISSQKIIYAPSQSNVEILNESNIDFIVINNWTYGELLNPEIRVYDNVKKMYYNEGELGYNDVKLPLTNGSVKFNWNINAAAHTETIYYYLNGQKISKVIKFVKNRRNVELIAPEILDVDFHDNITFNVTIKDYEKIPVSEHRPTVRCLHEDVKLIGSDGHGVFTFIYTPYKRSSYISIISSDSFNVGSIRINCNIHEIEPIFEPFNNAAVNLSDDIIQFNFVNGNNFSATGLSFAFKLETENGIINSYSIRNNTVFFKNPFKTEGYKNVKFIYPGIKSAFNYYENNFTLKLVRELPSFSFNNYVGKFNQPIPITINVSNVLGKYPTGNAILKVNNEEYDLCINNSIISVDVHSPDKPGIYTADFIYDGDEKYFSISFSFDISFKQDVFLITNDCINVVPDDEINLELKALTDLNSNAVIDEVNVYMGTNLIKCHIVENSIKFRLPKTINFNTMTISFDGNDAYNSAFKTINVLKKITNIEPPECIINKEPLLFNLPIDAKGTVTIEINSKTYNSTILKGAVEFDISELGSGTYGYVISYGGDNNYGSFTKTGNITIKTMLSNIIVPQEFNPSIDKTMMIKLPEDANGTIILTINNVVHTCDVVRGIANVKISELANGNYPYTITYSGDDKYSSFSKSGLLTVNKQTTPAKPVTKTTLTLKKVTVKRSAKKLTIQATLKINGKAVKGKWIKFKFNKKTYKSKTNAKGIAKITVKKSVLKKLKKGKKVTYTATYGKITKKVIVKVKK